MLTLLLRFPAGRFHATPWGHHVNEGLVEWPPSPWRILRALVATGYTKLGWNTMPGQARALVERLAATLPRYRLPRAGAAHSRHYMPLGRLDKGREKTTLVFDTWLQVGDQVLAVAWDLELPSEERALLGVLAGSLSYLGRAESWVEGSLLDEGQALPDGVDGVPHTDREHRGAGWEQVSLLAAEPAPTYSQWREHAVAAALAPYPLGETRKPSKKLLTERRSAEAPYPVDLMACREMETSELQRYGWSQPPGSRRVLYWRPSDVLAPAASAAAPVRGGHRVECVLLALATQSGNAHALPSRTRTVPQAELIHRALVSLVNAGGHAEDAPELVGRDTRRQPLKGHRHAHVLPLDMDADGHLDHVLIWAPMGIGPVGQGVIRKLRRTFAKRSSELRVAMAAIGALGDLRQLAVPWGRAVTRLLGPAGGACVWRSLTPFVTPRYVKPRGAHTLVGQVNAELACRSLPLAAVEAIPYHDAHARRLRHFVRVRTRGGAPPPVDAWYDLRLTFDTAVPGPLALGYGSHFGLGLFEAEA